MEIAVELSIPKERIVIYGSSLGGFGALMLSACIPGSKAVAEVPQLDFMLWHRRAIEDVENYILNGTNIRDFRKSFPERVSVLHRFLRTERIPQFTIITNPTDHRITEQRNFFKWVANSSLEKAGMNLIIETDEVAGHKVLPKRLLVPFVNP